MKRYVLLTAVVLLVSITVFSQSSKLDFTQKKATEQGLIVYFEVEGISDESEAIQIQDDFLKDNNISYSKYFIGSSENDRYQLTIDSSVDAEYIRDILISHNVDFNYTTISIDGVTEIEQSNSNIPSSSPKTYITSMGFPKYNKTDNKSLDDNNYKTEKDQWINDNPEEYKKLLEDLENKSTEKE